MNANHPNQSLSKESFPFYSFRGSHREIGRQYGKACETLIRRHLELVENRMKDRAGADKGKIEAVVMQFRAFVRQYASYFDEEIAGLSEGAGITLAEAYTLQLRAELNRQLSAGNECTTYAVRRDKTANDVGLIGQDADLPAFYAEIGVVTEIIPDDAPAILQFTPAGQISYIGMNNQGMTCFGNFLSCDGWKVGFPRYLLSRLALTHTSVSDALAHLKTIERASSRNLIMMDGEGNMADFETTADRYAILCDEDGLLCHSNHYLSEELLSEERHTVRGLANSRARYARMHQLLAENAGSLDADKMETILRDRTGEFPICRMLGDEASDTITAASVIAMPALGKMRVAIGPPNLYEYRTYQFSK